MKKTILICGLLLSLLSFNSKATVIYVDSTHVGGTQNGLSWATAFSNFQSGINAAIANDSVWVAKGTYQATLNGSFAMKQGVKIFGGFLNTNNSFSQRNWQTNNTVLKGNGQSVIRNDNNSLTNSAVLDGFIITDGKSDNKGGGMYNNYASPLIINCIFSNNTFDNPNVAGGGGGMYNMNSSPFIANCIFSYNSCNSYNIDGGGGGMQNLFSSPTIDDCIFSYNSSKGNGNYGNGGGMYNYGSSIVINDCTFSSDTAIGNGGGMCNITSSFEINNCIFSQNFCNATPYGGGGGIYNGSVQNASSINNCSFSSNICNSGSGGGMYNTDSLSINNCIFSFNSSKSGSGGGMVNTGVFCKPTINNCLFLNNTSTGSGGTGGGIANSLDAKPNIEGCTFSYNSCYSGGGAINNYYSSPIIHNCIISNNNCVASVSGGGGIYSGTFSSPTISFCTFENNTAHYGGGIYIADTSTKAISNCNFINNHGLIFGGGIYNGSHYFSIINSSFTGNNAALSGGGIYDIYHSTIDSCNFTLNTASSGGGLFIATTSISVINNSTFAHNTVSNDGGGIYNFHCNVSKINNCTFVKNLANGTGGGAIYNQADLSPDSIGEIKNCFFQGNKALVKGGAVFNAEIGNNLYKISNCRFEADTALIGAGIYNHYSSPVIANSLFLKNIADSIGAAVFNIYESSPKVVNCTVVGNKAGIDGGGIASAANSDPLISNTILWNNSSGISNDSITFSMPTYSLIQGFPANNITHNIDGIIDPLFVDTSMENYRLKAISPCINAGNNDSIPIWSNADLDGNYRVFGPLVDIGAYEYLLPPYDILTMDTTICSGDSIILNAQNPGATYLWSTGDTTQTILVADSGTYIVAISNLVGSIFDTTVVTTIQSPTLDLGNDTAFCFGNTITLDAQNAGSFFNWNTGDTSQVIHVNTTNTYKVTVTGINNCKVSDSIQVTVNMPPLVNLGNDMTIGLPSFTLDAGNPGATYLWSTGAITQTITINTSGTYSVTVINASGCSSSDTITITMSSDGIDEVDALSKTISIYPNPSKNNITIDIKDLKLLRTEAILTDAYGSTILTITIDNKLQQVPLYSLASGLYTLKMANGATVKFVKE